MTYNAKKKASNERYLAKFKSYTIRVTAEEKDRIDQAAAAAGQSTSAFILDAVRARMAGGEN